MKAKGSIRIRKLITVIPPLILAAFLSFLLVINYRSQVRLKKTALSRMVDHAQTQASNLSRYFNRRREDLEAIAGSRPLMMFYENQALGMSMAYGLKASLDQIEQLFQRIFKETTIDGTPVFQKIVLLDKDGGILCEKSFPRVCLNEQLPWRRYLTPAARSPVIRADRLGVHIEILVSAPFFFKDQFAGQIITWVNPASIFRDAAFHNESGQHKKVYILFDAKDKTLVYPEPEEEILDSLASAEIRTPVRHVTGDEEAGGRDVILVKVHIPGTDFFMVVSQPVLEVAGYTDPSHLLLAMAILAVFVVGSLVSLWRMNARELVLKTLLEQENIRKKEIEEKNIALETEVMISNSLEKSLKESEEKFKTVSMAAQDAIIMVDNDGQISFWNRAATAIFGYSAHEAMERDFREILLPVPIHERYSEEFEAFRKTGKGRAVGRTVEVEVKNRRGALFPVELSLSAVKLDDKWHAIGIIRDITRRKEAEAEIENHRKNLEVLVAERTRDLEKAQKELVRKAVDAGRAQLSSMVLHNIGNAITPVAVNTEMLEKSDLEKINQYLNACYSDLIAHKETLTEYVTEDGRGIQILEYMGKLINEMAVCQGRHKQQIQSISAGIEYVAEILSLQSAYAPGRNEMKESVNLNDLIRDALKIQESAILKRNIRVDLSLHHSPLTIITEKNKLMQVLVNCIKNSCEAMDEDRDGSGHRLRVSICPENEGVLITMADSGCGIAPEDLDTVFDLGVSSKGTSGFGLYYCKTFIEANQGTMQLKSRGKGMGATVSIRF